MKISQREARRLRKRVEELEQQEKYRRNRWASDWHGLWVNILSVNLDAAAYATIKTARILQHAVICLPDGNGTTVRLYAEKL